MPHSITDKGDYNPFQTAHQARNVRRAHEQALHREKIALARTPEGANRKIGAAHRAHLNRTGGGGVIDELQNNAPPRRKLKAKRRGIG